MPLSITIPNPNGKGEPVILHDDEQVVLRMNVSYTSTQKEPISREILVYLHGEEQPDGNCNGAINVVVKA